MSAPVSLIADLHVADRAYDGDEAYDDFRTFFIGALSHLVTKVEGGPEAWHAAIAVAQDRMAAAAAEFDTYASAALALFRPPPAAVVIDELAARRQTTATGGTR